MYLESTVTKQFLRRLKTILLCRFLEFSGGFKRMKLRCLNYDKDILLDFFISKSKIILHGKNN